MNYTFLPSKGRIQRVKIANRCLKLIVIISFIFLLLYLVINIFLSIKTKTVSITLPLNQKEYVTNKNIHYVERSTLGPSIKFITEDNEEKAQIIKPVILFRSYPKIYPIGKRIEISVLLQDNNDDDWEISLFCPVCNPQNQFNWQPFYSGKLSQYHQFDQINQLHIYQLEDKNQDQLSTETIKDWILKNTNPDQSIEIIHAPSLSVASLSNDQIDYQKNRMRIS